MSDTDGYTSSAVIYNYIKRISPDIEITFHIHDKKIHGVFSKDISDDIDLVIIPDAGSNNYTELEKLYDRGIDVVVLD